MDIRIPFSHFHVNEGVKIKGKRTGMVDFRNYSFPVNAELVFLDGQQVFRDHTSRSWASLPSSLSKVAMGYFPEGNGYDLWPHIRLKCSPAKILQGHNVFGSEDSFHGTVQMISYVNMAFPDIYKHLDLDLAEIYYTDSTYSARIPSQYFRDSIFRLFEGLAHTNQKVYRDKGYLQLGSGSERTRQKIYEKTQELLADLENAKKCRHKDRVEILSDPRLQDFALDLMRFEATTGRRLMIEQGVPTNLWEFFKFETWYKKTYSEPLCRHLWRKSFAGLLEQIKGQTMKNVDDGVVKTKIFARYTKVKSNGKVCKRLANAIYTTYRDIKHEGYSTMVKERNQTFYRNVNFLVDIGLSRAFLKSLDPVKPNTNVVPIVQMIDIDFSKQRPDWFVEPKSGYNDERVLLKLVS